MDKPAKKTKGKPAKKTKLERFPGGVSKSKGGPARYPFAVRYPGKDEDGNDKRMVRWFTNDTEALAFAKEKSGEAGELGASFGTVSEAERSALAAFRRFVGRCESPKPPALGEILREYADRWEASQGSLTVGAVVAKYEAAKTAEGLRPMSLQALRTRCGRFAAEFGERPIASIAAAEISDWILGLQSTRNRGATKGGEVGLQTKKNHRLGLAGLFNFAKSRGWVRENPVMDAAKPRPPKSRPGILRPVEAGRFLAALQDHARDLVPFWTVRLFAGIREQEALRMDWSMIDLEAGEIHLPDTVTKTGQARTVKIEASLAAFLAPHAMRYGAIVTASAMRRRYQLAKAHRALQAEDAARKTKGEEIRPFPVPMPANAARHSYATYHLLAFRNAGETALQLGHKGDPELLHNQYVGEATEAEAVEFWKIKPAAAPENVVAMKANPGAAADKSKARNRKKA